MEKMKIFRYLIRFISILTICIFILLFNELKNIYNSFELSGETAIEMKVLFIITASGIGLTCFLTLFSFMLRSEESIRNKKSRLKQKNNNDQKKPLIQSNAEELKQTSISEILESIPKSNTIEEFCSLFLSIISKKHELMQAIFYIKRKETETFELKGSYAFYSKSSSNTFEIGDGISGQVAKNKEPLYITNVPDDYITVMSGLGKSTPRYLLVLPVVSNDETIGIIELASFKEISLNKENFMATDSNEIATKVLSFLK